MDTFFKCGFAACIGYILCAIVMTLSNPNLNSSKDHHLYLDIDQKLEKIQHSVDQQRKDVMRLEESLKR